MSSEKNERIAIILFLFIYIYLIYYLLNSIIERQLKFFIFVYDNRYIINILAWGKVCNQENIF